MNYIDLRSDEPTTRAQFKLDSQFREKRLLGISGIGSTPGLTNIMLRHIEPQFDTIETVHFGFAWNSNIPIFVVPFSIDPIVDEFTEPAIILENGKFIKKKPDQLATIDYEYRSIGKQDTRYVKHIEQYTFRKFLRKKRIKSLLAIWRG
jgi:saccharopine dehydrogenase-like NADP-dependent oxidoreductase